MGEEWVWVITCIIINQFFVLLFIHGRPTENRVSFTNIFRIKKKEHCKKNKMTNKRYNYNNTISRNKPLQSKQLQSSMNSCNTRAVNRSSSTRDSK